MVDCIINLTKIFNKLYSKKNFNSPINNKKIIKMKKLNNIRIKMIKIIHNNIKPTMNLNKSPQIKHIRIKHMMKLKTKVIQINMINNILNTSNSNNINNKKN